MSLPVVRAAKNRSWSLGISALVGVLAAYGTADERVRSNPYCERCQKYMKKRTLWTVHAVEAAHAFQALDYGRIGCLPFCMFSHNHIAVDVWSCRCDKEHFLELTGQAAVPDENSTSGVKKKDPVRVYSRSLSTAQQERVRGCG